MFKRFLCFFIICVLVVSPVSVFASSAGSVVVAGGSIATGGLSSDYSDKTEKTAITLTMALLYSLGVTTHLTQEAISAGQSAYSYVQSLMSEWVSGTSAEQMSASDRAELKRRFSVINGGGNIDPTGNIFLNGTALDLFRQFVNWCKSNNKITDSSQIESVPSSGTIQGLTTVYTSYLEDPDTNISYIVADTDYPVGTSVSEITDRVPVLWYRFHAFKSINEPSMPRIRPITASLSDPFIYLMECENGVVDSATHYYFNQGAYGYSYAEGYWIPDGDTNLFAQCPYINNTNYPLWVDWLNGGGGSISYGDPVTDLPDGLAYDGDLDTSQLDNPDNNQTIINPGLLPTIANDNPGKDYQVSADDYLEAIRQVLNEKTNPAEVPEQLPVTDVPTGVTVPVDIPADQPASWPITTPSSPTATPDVPTGSTPVVDPATPADPETAIPKLVFPLDEYFPFCIPFDIYALLSKFSADPVAPVFDWSFTEPFSDSTVTVHIDLSMWDSVASAVRVAELGAFIVGLAVVSRKIFTRG